jgi:hypothetical protein
LTGTSNPAATAHIPFFITPPGNSDVLFNVTLVLVVASIIFTGVIFLTIHSLPERMAHKSKKIQFDIVAVLGLLGLLSHEHVFWVAALLLAFVDIPDFLTPFRSIATSVKSIAGQKTADSLADHSASSLPAIADRSPHDGKEAGHA